MRNVLKAILAATVMGAAGAQAQDPPMTVPAIPEGSGEVLAVWTQFVAGSDLAQKNQTIELRYVLTGKIGCGGPVLKQMPSGSAVAKVRTHMSGTFHKNSNPSKNGTEYTVTICAAELDAATQSVELQDGAGKALGVYPHGVAARVPGPARLGNADGTGKTLSGIAVGDTGCRGQDPTHPHRRDQQVCNKVNWPFRSMMEDAAKLNPDFVLHVGDYHYFWEKNRYWGNRGGNDRIEFWLQEFLYPAAPLLRTAPWLLARGNHEICFPGSWFGDGFHALFGPDSMDATASHCASPVSPTWAVDLAPADDATQGYRFTMIDTAQATNRGGFAQAAKHSVLNTGDGAGWITHYPPIKMAHYRGHWHYSDGGIFGDIQAAYKDPNGKVLPVTSPCAPGKLCMPDAVFVGHQHFYQSFDFGDDLPLVNIVGHGGTGIDHGGVPSGSSGNVGVCTRDFAAEMPFVLGDSAAVATLETAQYHGFVQLKRSAGNKNMDASGWERVLHWANGRTVNFGTPNTCVK